MSISIVKFHSIVWINHSFLFWWMDIWVFPVWGYWESNYCEHSCIRVCVDLSLYFSEGNTCGWKCWLLDSYMFSFIRNCQIFSQAGGTILYSHQEWMRVLAPYLHKHLICPEFKPRSVSLQSIPAQLSACPLTLGSVSPLPWKHLSLLYKRQYALELFLGWPGSIPSLDLRFLFGEP